MLERAPAAGDKKGTATQWGHTRVYSHLDEDTLPDGALAVAKAILTNSAEHYSNGGFKMFRNRGAWMQRFVDCIIQKPFGLSN